MMTGVGNISTVLMDGVDKPVSSQWLLIWRGINLFMAVFFLLATLANVNDDDWYLWIPIYIIPALLSLVVVVNHNFIETKLWGSLAVVHFTLCLAYTIYQLVILIEALAGKLKNPLEHEEGREMGGLLIIMTWIGICRFTNLGRPNVTVTNRSLMNALLLMTVTLAVLPLLLWSLCFISDWHTKIGHCNGMFA